MWNKPICNPLFCLTVLAGVISQQFPGKAVFAGEQGEADINVLRSALTFHASFDQGMDATFGKGDLRLHSATSLDNRKNGKPGLPENSVVSLAKGEGRFGDALRFHRAATEVVFFQVEQNLLYSKSNWSGTISFWLKLDPNKDLGPGYCDPLFITPRVYNDGALWVDFNDKAPRHFRHGAVPDRRLWDSKVQDFEKLADAERPLVTVTQPPFSSGNWTHIVVAFSNFNTGKSDGVSTLYLNGKPAGKIGPREQTFTWEPSQSTAVLGINYVGMFDELAFFSRALSASEVQNLYDLPGGIAKAP